jgi:hypothetical protein
MSLQDLLTQQIIAFHTAILDSCRRSGQPEQSDAMALRLRGNVVSMTKLQLSMIALAQTDATEPEPPPPEEAFDPDDHQLTGDALSRFVSRRLGPDEDPQAAWQAALRESDDATRGSAGKASGRRLRDVNARPP